MDKKLIKLEKKIVLQKCSCPPGLDWYGFPRAVAVKIPKFITLTRNCSNEIRESVCIDACLVSEIYELWRAGIVTTGCCCGHNHYEEGEEYVNPWPPYIGVKEEFIPKMKELGYQVQPNEHYPTREDSFVPKSLKKVGEISLSKMKELIIKRNKLWKIDSKN